MGRIRHHDMWIDFRCVSPLIYAIGSPQLLREYFKTISAPRSVYKFWYFLFLGIHVDEIAIEMKYFTVKKKDLFYDCFKNINTDEYTMETYFSRL